MGERPSVVLAHYDTESLTRLREELEREGFRVQATGSGRDALDRIRQSRPDAAVLEVLLPRVNGLQVLKEVKEDPTLEGVRVLVLLDDADTYTENRALICGADGIVRRGPEGRVSDGALPAKLRSVLAEGRLGGDGTDETDEIRRMLDSAGENLRAENPIVAHITDRLTGLYNADYLLIKLAEEFKRTRRFGLPLSLVSVQLRVGPEAEEPDMDAEWGRVLNEAAGLLLCESRDIDVLARTGPDRFDLILPHTPATGAETMVGRVLGQLQARGLTYGAASRPVVAGSGISSFVSDDVGSWEELRRRADEALAASWRSGGGRNTLWSPALRAGT